jgi:hypothetical protein
MIPVRSDVQREAETAPPHRGRPAQSRDDLCGKIVVARPRPYGWLSPHHGFTIDRLNRFAEIELLPFVPYRDLQPKAVGDKAKKLKGLHVRNPRDQIGADFHRAE